jgi:hypothetical protein
MFNLPPIEGGKNPRGMGTWPVRAKQLNGQQSTFDLLVVTLEAMAS